MAKRRQKILSVPLLAKCTTPGKKYADGNGLYLSVTPSGSRNWILIFMYRGRTRTAGLGSCLDVSLADARQMASEFKALLAKGIDPIDQRREARKAAIPQKTFAACADALIHSMRSKWRSAAHAEQWKITLGAPCKAIQNLPVDQITTEDVLQVLRPIWSATPTTAGRLMNRIAKVLDYARAHGFRSGDNPAAWKDHLSHLLAPYQVDKVHMAAMPYVDVPAFVQQLAESNSVSTLALAFLILTAARSREVREAPWSEIDLEAKIWTVKAERMKSGKIHRVPLSDAAMALLAAMDQIRTSDFIFPGQKPNQPMVGASLMNLVRKEGCTVHGFRSSFAVWCIEQTDYPFEARELALAHRVGNATSRAYDRSDLLDKRRPLMNEWAIFLGVQMKPIDLPWLDVKLLK